MTILSQKKNILKNAVKKQSSTGFYDLNGAEEGLKYAPKFKGRRLYQNINSDIEAFGDQLKNPKFKKGLRDLQEKYKVTYVA